MYTIGFCHLVWYNELGYKLEFPNYATFSVLSLKILAKFTSFLAKNADPDEMSHADELSGSSQFAKVPIYGFPAYKKLTLCLIGSFACFFVIC